MSAVSIALVSWHLSWSAMARGLFAVEKSRVDVAGGGLEQQYFESRIGQAFLGLVRNELIFESRVHTWVNN